MSLAFEIVDVFAEHALAGNPLAVLRGASTLTTEQMQRIAREINFSETTFVTEETPASGNAPPGARVRIFMPNAELPFAGHPTIGTAWALTRGRSPITLDLAAGPVAVDFEDGVVWMSPPQPTLGAVQPAHEVADQLGLPESALSERLPVRPGAVGIDFLLVGLASVAHLESVAIRPDALSRISAHSVFFFAPVPEADREGPGHHYRARMFFEANGVREDPATGSANSVFAHYLESIHGDRFDALVDQGVEMGRPSRIYLSVQNGAIRVGGRVQPVAEGEWSAFGAM